MKGLPGYRFSPPSKVFANLTVNPANAGFCVPAGNCLGSGVLNVSACKQGGKCNLRLVKCSLGFSPGLFVFLNLLCLIQPFVCSGAPIVMSSPHFYQADEKFVEDIFGMNPNKELHQTTIDIQPVGITISILNMF